MKLNQLLSQAKKYENDVVATGFRDLDKVIGGLPVGHICAVAGRPAMGKTAFAMNIAKNIGIINKIPTVIFSIEDSDVYVMKKLVAAQFGWNADFNYDSEPVLSDYMSNAVSLMNNAGFTDIEGEKKIYLQKMKEAPLWVEHSMDFTMDEIIIRMERMKKKDDIKVLIIDCFDSLLTGMNFADKERAAVKLAQMADRLKIAVLVTTSLNRSVEVRGGEKIPMLCDLNGGTNLETVASTVLLLYRPEYYCITEDWTGESTKNRADVYVAKNRFGLNDCVHLQLLDHSRFEDMPDHMDKPESEHTSIRNSAFLKSILGDIEDTPF